MSRAWLNYYTLLVTSKAYLEKGFLSIQYYKTSNIIKKMKLIYFVIKGLLLVLHFNSYQGIDFLSLNQKLAFD
jgi:hypothetical protein